MNFAVITKVLLRGFLYVCTWLTVITNTIVASYRVGGRSDQADAQAVAAVAERYTKPNDIVSW